MKHDQMLQKAELIARTLHCCSCDLEQKHIGKVPLMAYTSISQAFQNQGMKGLNARFKEILLFGSTARGEVEPNDIDMMVFDGGFYSNIIDFEPSKKTSFDAGSHSSWGGIIEGTLNFLLTEWFGCRNEDVHFDEVLVDLHVLPITIITNPELRRSIGEKHADKNFFTNAFSTILRFDEGLGKFVPTTLREMEEKHQADKVALT